MTHATLIKMRSIIEDVLDRLDDVEDEIAVIRKKMFLLDQYLEDETIEFDDLLVDSYYQQDPKSEMSSSN
jgi:hypothetical protein